MSDTDLAFIAAYQQSQSDATETTAEPSLRGPHFEAVPGRRHTARSSRRAPLSSLIQAPPQQEPTPGIEPALELDCLAWPELAQRLAVEQHTRLEALLGAATDRGTGAMALIAARAGVGLTTLTLALARVAAAAGNRVALIDAAPGAPRMAASLGVRRLPTLIDAADSEPPFRGCVVRAIRDQVSLMVAGPGWRGATAQELIRCVGEEADTVLIDAGALSDSPDDSLAWVNPTTTTVLVDEEGGPGGVREQALTILGAAGGHTLGVVETLAQGETTFT